MDSDDSSAAVMGIEVFNKPRGCAEKHNLGKQGSTLVLEVPTQRALAFYSQAVLQIVGTKGRERRKSNRNNDCLTQCFSGRAQGAFPAVWRSKRTS